MTRTLAFVAPRDARPMGALLELQAERAPDAPALTCDGMTLSRAEVARRAEARARSLRAAGVQAGDFVALALPTGPAVLELAFGCWRLGATPAPQCGHASRPACGGRSRSSSNMGGRWRWRSSPVSQRLSAR